MKKWHKAYEAENQLPWIKLDFFMKLFDRLFPDCTKEQRWRVKWLNDQRNQFTYFYTVSLLLHLPTGINCCILLSYSLQDQVIFFYGEADSLRFYTSLEEAKTVTSNLTKIRNDLVQSSAEAAAD